MNTICSLLLTVSFQTMKMKKERFFLTSVCILAVGALSFVVAVKFSSSPTSLPVSNEATAQEAASGDVKSKSDSSEEGAPVGQGADGPAVVAVSPAIAIDILEPRQYPGTLVPIDDVDIVPRVTGWINKVNFKEGDLVKTGDLLFEIEDTTYQAAVSKAEANLAQSQAELKNAEINYNRADDLLERNAGSQMDFDNAEQRLSQAKALVQLNEAALADAKNTLSYTKITSPIDGRIGKVTVTRGNLVTPQTGKIVDIKSFAPIYVRFAIGESVFNRKFEGEKRIRDLAEIHVCPVGEDRDDVKKIAEYPTAEITLIDNKVDSSTNTVDLWATLKNEDFRFFPGSYATVLLSRKLEKPVVGMLISALQTSPDGNYVYILDENNRAVQREVKLGPISGKYQIVTAGLEAGETVVVEGMNKLQPGAPAQPLDVETLRPYVRSSENQ